MQLLESSNRIQSSQSNHRIEQGKQMRTRSSVSPILFVACLLMAIVTSRADEADIIKQLMPRGATFKATNGVTTGAQIADCTKWTEADFKSLAQLTQLRDLDFSSGLTDQQVLMLAPLVE